MYKSTFFSFLSLLTHFCRRMAVMRYQLNINFFSVSSLYCTSIFLYHYLFFMFWGFQRDSFTFCKTLENIGIFVDHCLPCMQRFIVCVIFNPRDTGRHSSGSQVSVTCLSPLLSWVQIHIFPTTESLS